MKLEIKLEKGKYCNGCPHYYKCITIRHNRSKNVLKKMEYKNDQT